MVDSEDIIRSVKKYRPIWDLEDQGYHNKNLKDEAWDCVGRDLIPNWNTLPVGEQYIKQLELKKKWNNIRDYYKKLLSEQQSGDHFRAKKRRYLYSHILEFIRPVYDKKRQELNSINSDDSNTEVLESCDTRISDKPEQESENETQEDLETVTFIGIPPSQDPVRRQQRPKLIAKPKDRRTYRPASKIKKKTPPLSVFERTVLKSLEKKYSPKEEDPDLLFLKSLLPDIKALKSSQKLDFKLGVMELYRNIISQNEQPDINHDHDYDIDSLSDQIKVETVRLSVDEDNYET